MLPLTKKAPQEPQPELLRGNMKFGSGCTKLGVKQGYTVRYTTYLVIPGTVIRSGGEFEGLVLFSAG